MKLAYWSFLAVGILLVISAAGCGRTVTPAAPAPTADTTIAATTRSSSAGSVSASVQVKPAQTSDMAFLIAAPVKQIKVKEGDQVRAGQALIVLDTPDLDSAVASAQAVLQSAQANQTIQHQGGTSNIRRGHNVTRIGSMPEIREQADARVLQAQAGLDSAKAELTQGTLVAPFDGTVASVSVNPGEMVEANKTVLVIGDLSHLQVVTTDLSEREIAKVRIGQPATIRLKAFAQDLPGKVVAIAPLSGLNNGDTVFQVTMELSEQPAGLLWGMTGDVNIQVDR